MESSWQKDAYDELERRAQLIHYLKSQVERLLKERQREVARFCLRPQGEVSWPAASLN